MKKTLFLLSLIGVLTLAAAAQNNGKITGKLTYPSEFIPADIVVCVESSERIVCSNSKNKKGFIFKVNAGTARYEVSIPPGNYFIYAETRESAGVKAYYNDFVKCGMSVDCDSKEKIRIIVDAGKTVKGITVGDFY